MEEVETGDLFKGAYLLCRGGRLLRTTLSGRDHIVFVIEGEGLLAEDVRFRTGAASVNPLQLRETLNYLRDVVFEKTRVEKRRSLHASHPAS